MGDEMTMVVERKILGQDVEGNTLPHGGIVRVPGPFDKSHDEVRAVGNQLLQAIQRGMSTLAAGSSPFASDVAPAEGAEIETMDYFDIETGEHVICWRVACQER